MPNLKKTKSSQDAVYTDGQLQNIFKSIGQSKVVTAQDIRAQKDKAERQKISSIASRLPFLSFGGNYDDNGATQDDIDAEMQQLEAEIARVQAGEAHKYTQDDVLGDEAPADDIKDAQASNNAGAERQPPVLNADGAAPDMDTLLHALQNAPAPPRVELLGAGAEKVVRVYFAYVYAQDASTGAWAYQIRQEDDAVLATSAKKMVGDSVSVLASAFAQALGEALDACSNVVVYMPADTEAAVRSLTNRDTVPDQLAHLLDKLGGEKVFVQIMSGAKAVAAERQSALTLLAKGDD